MRRMHGMLLTFIGLLPVPTIAAQPVPTPGTRVRIVSADGQPLISGMFARLAGDTVVLTDAGGAQQALTLQRGRFLEVSTGMHRRTRRGMAIGLLVGAGTGALLGSAVHKPPSCKPDCWSVQGPEISMAVGTVALGVPGIVIGWFVGKKAREEWRPAHVGAPPIVLLPSDSHRVALVASVRFP